MLIHALILLQADGESAWDKIADWLADEGVALLIIAVVVLVSILIVNRVVPPVMRAAAETNLARQAPEDIQKRTDTLSRVITRSVTVLIIVLGLLSALTTIGLDVAPLLAGVGIVGIAIGFGAQSLVKDLFAGLFILLENQYARGDVITVAGVSGTVEDVDLRRTVLRDLDGTVHYVPNGQIMVASNQTQGYSRVNLNVAVAYTEDLARVTAVINRVGEQMLRDEPWSSMVLSAPKVLRVDAFSDTGVELKILGDVRPTAKWEVMGELRRRLKIAFDAEGIHIPRLAGVVVRSGGIDELEASREAGKGGSEAEDAAAD